MALKRACAARSLLYPIEIRYGRNLMKSWPLAIGLARCALDWVTLFTRAAIMSAVLILKGFWNHTWLASMLV